MNEELENESTVVDSESSDLSGWTTNNPLPVQIIDPADSSETDSEIYLDSFDQETEIIVDSVEPYVNNSRSSSVADFKNLWRLAFNNQSYDVLFPENAPLSVVNGKLYNTGSDMSTASIV